MFGRFVARPRNFCYNVAQIRRFYGKSARIDPAPFGLALASSMRPRRLTADDAGSGATSSKPSSPFMEPLAATGIARHRRGRRNWRMEHMDSALLGVVIGSLASILATIVGQWFTARKEADQWGRSQKAEAEKRLA